VASGKTSVGRALAQRLGYRFVDTGLMYRAVTWMALERHVPLDDDEALGALAREASVDIVANPEGGESRVMAGGVDVTAYLLSSEVEQAVSLVSRVAVVRRAMVAVQKRMAEAGRVVMVGRDIGTKVLPDAPLKVYLEASMEERVRRRYEERREAGHPASIGGVREGLGRRDELDSQRAESPLRPAADAVHVATDRLTVEGVVERILGLVAKE
jgi:cytidylate kinase